MKAASSGVVLCYNFEKEKLDKLSVMCRKLGIRVRDVASADFDKSIGEMFGFAGASASVDGGSSASAFDDEMLVMYNFAGSALDKFLNALRKYDVTVELKAILTPSNKDWTPAALCKELRREREQIGK